VYAIVSYDDAFYVLASKRVEKVFAGKQYTIVEDGIAGSSLLGVSYKPPYDYFYSPNQKGEGAKNHHIYA
jgi:isoleucyl-tRNA synthetase